MKKRDERPRRGQGTRRGRKNRTRGRRPRQLYDDGARFNRPGSATPTARRLERPATTPDQGGRRQRSAKALRKSARRKRPPQASAADGRTSPPRAPPAPPRSDRSRPRPSCVLRPALFSGRHLPYRVTLSPPSPRGLAWDRPHRPRWPAHPSRTYHPSAGCLPRPPADPCPARCTRRNAPKRLGVNALEVLPEVLVEVVGDLGFKHGDASRPAPAGAGSRGEARWGPGTRPTGRPRVERSRATREASRCVSDALRAARKG